MITNDSMNAVAENFRNWGLKCDVGDRFLGIIPIFSSYGLVCGMHMPLCMGFELVTVPKFDPLEFGSLVKKYRPNHMISTPAFYEMLMDSKEMENMDLSFLITLGSGGDTMNEGLEEKLSRFMEEHNIRYPLAQGYGMSELSAAATFCANDINKPGSVGIPSPSTVVGIFDPDTQEELDEAKNAVKKLGLQVEQVAEFPADGTAHTVIVLKKTSPTPPQYPRRYAKIKQNPL